MTRWKITISEKEICSFNFNIKEIVTDSLKEANDFLVKNGYIAIDSFIDGMAIIKHENYFTKAIVRKVVA